MSSLRQIEANRRNALKSTGPTTDAGKRRSHRNALRHGLTAEAVIEVLEDPKDYEAFEKSVIADFDAQTAVERELVLRLANLLWRLRRAIATETGLLQIQSDIIREAEQEQTAVDQLPERGVEARWLADSASSTHPHAGWVETRAGHAGTLTNGNGQDQPGSAVRPLRNTNAQIALCFLRLANLDNGAFERLNRYETALWRQACQILFTLKFVRRPTRSDSWDSRPRSFNPLLG
jgi:hypothetical protein